MKLAILASVLAMASLLFVAPAAAQSKDDITPAEQAHITKYVGPPAKAVPFFFPAGIIQTTDPVLQRQEYMRYLASTWSCNQGNPNGPQSLIPEPGSISVQTKILSSSYVGKASDMRVVLDHFVKQPDGRVRVTTLCGQYFITAEQEQIVETQFIALIQNAAQRDYDFYNVITDLAIKARAQKLGISEADFRAQMDTPMVDNPHVTYREFNRIPKPTQVSDFVPREIHLGFNIPLGGILGVTWLNTGIIYYNPDAWIRDYLTDQPEILQHEMVHCNSNVEKFPMTEAFDAELLADMPIVLDPNNELDLPTHSYAKDLREMFLIYFNDDFDEAQKQSFKIDLAGNQVLDEDKYRYYHQQHDIVKAEARHFFQTVTIPEFYSDPIWWGSVNNIRGDNNSVFRMTLALHYNPTLLGGSKATLDWLEGNREIIMETAELGFRRGLGGDEPTDSDDFKVPQYLMEMYERIFSPVERTKIEAYYKAHPDELAKVKKMSPDQLMDLAKKFKEADKGVTIDEIR
ncbi:MAG: hypothetical protein WA766_14110 [Candidatus Acidiferrales bacterium]